MCFKWRRDWRTPPARVVPRAFIIFFFSLSEQAYGSWERDTGDRLGSGSEQFCVMFWPASEAQRFPYLNRRGLIQRQREPPFRRAAIAALSGGPRGARAATDLRPPTPLGETRL